MFFTSHSWRTWNPLRFLDHDVRTRKRTVTGVMGGRTAYELPWLPNATLLPDQDVARDPPSCEPALTTKGWDEPFGSRRFLDLYLANMEWTVYIVSLSQKRYNQYWAYLLSTHTGKIRTLQQPITLLIVCMRNWRWKILMRNWCWN